VGWQVWVGKLGAPQVRTSVGGISRCKPWETVRWRQGRGVIREPEDHRGRYGRKAVLTGSGRSSGSLSKRRPKATWVGRKRA
jgi:hypothetical protein